MSPILAENRKRYPDNWKAISDAIRFGRAEGACECSGECGLPDHRRGCPAVHGEINPETDRRVVLTVGHLDHQPENCADENLRAWCQRCHNRYDRSHRNATRKRRTWEAIESSGQLRLDSEVG